MSRILFLKTSLNPNNSAALPRRPAFVNGASVALLTLATALSLVAGTAAAGTSTSSKAAAPTKSAAMKDPLAGDTWHADTPAGTWPGTLVFDATKKSVVLSPVGATPMTATYSYTVKPSLNQQVIEGTLRMTNSAKQVSDSTFKIQGKVLTLSYGQGQRPETYVRMTPQDEAAEKARLEKLISEGRIRPIK